MTHIRRDSTVQEHYRTDMARLEAPAWTALCGAVQPGSSFSLMHIQQSGGVSAALRNAGGAIDICTGCAAVADYICDHD